MIKLIFALLSACCSVCVQAQSTLTFSYDAAGNQVQYRFCREDCNGEGLRTLADAPGKLPEEKTALTSGGRFYVFPNPTDGPLQLAFEGVESVPQEIKITDASGKVWQAWLKTDENTRSTDLSELPAGVYFLSFKIEEQEITKRILKK